jgi:Fe-Mn family superoxide dismutase
LGNRLCAFLKQKELAMAYSMKPLACDPTRIKGISERLIVSHYENNYGGAVNRLNAIAAQLADLDFAAAPVFLINGLKREELIAANSTILHELFFASLGDEGAPEGELREALSRDFGSLDKWRAEFSAMGKAQGGGSGWVLLTWLSRDRKLVNQWAMDHTTTLAGGQPIPRARYVRALLSHGLWGESGGLCRCLYGDNQLVKRRGRVRSSSVINY